LVKYLYFLKEEFDDKINKNEISKMFYNTYKSKMKNIRYIVLFGNNQYPSCICNLQLNKIIDVRKCIILYKIKNYKF
jgi:hypothetical protein